MKPEFPTASAAATRVPLYPSDAHAWDVHNGAAVSPTMHLLPVAKRLEDMVGRLFVDFVKTVDFNYASMLVKTEALRTEFSAEVAAFTSRVNERLGSIETVLDGKLSEELDPAFTRWLAGKTFLETETDPVFTAWVDSSSVRLGAGSSATSTTAAALGYNAKCSADGSVQLGNGTNSTRTSLQFRNANLFVQSSGSVAVLGTGFPKASASAYGAVKIGAGLTVSNGVVSSAGQANVIEEVKVNGTALAVVDKSVDIQVPAAPDKVSDGTNTINADRTFTTVGDDFTGWEYEYEGKGDWRELGWDSELEWLTCGEENSPMYGQTAWFYGGSSWNVASTDQDATRVAYQAFDSSGSFTVVATRRRLDESGKLALQSDIAEWARAGKEAPGGSVQSVNGKVGAVVLDGEDIDVGAGDSRSVTEAINDIESAFISHASDAENPHGVTAAQIGAVSTTDSRLTDARTPTKHASKHAKRGSDPITPDSIGALPVDGGEEGAWMQADIHMGANSIKFGELEVAINSADGTDLTVSASRVHLPSSVKKADKEVATEEHVDGMAKYPVVQKSGTTVMLEDRKVNVYSGTLSSDVTLVLPARNADGRVRDLEFRANVSGLRLVGVRRTDAAGAAVALFSMSPESAPAEEGVNAWYFTETGGEIRVERALLKPAGYQVKMDFTCGNTDEYSNDVDFLDSAGGKIKSIRFKRQKISEIVSGVASLRIDMSSYGNVEVNGLTYYYVGDLNPRTIALTGDSVITHSWADACLTPDAPILTPSGQVPLKDVRVGDTVLGIDSRGVLRTVRVTRCDTHLEKWAGACDRWTFRREDGDSVVVTTVNRHRFYNVERGAMVYMDEWIVGEHGRDSDGCDLELVSHEHVDEPTRHMTLFTETQTYFAHGLLSGNRHTPHIDWEDR